MAKTLSLFADPISHELTLSTEQYYFVFSLRTGKLNHRHASYQLNTVLEALLRYLQNQKITTTYAGRKRRACRNSLVQ